jgi:signal transduction histidine kinase
LAQAQSMNPFKALKGKAFVVPLVILAALLMLAVNEGAYWQSKRSMDKLVNIGTSRALIFDLTETLINADSRQRGYVLTGHDDLLLPLASELSEIKEALAQLARQHSRDPKFLAELERFRVNVDERLSHINEAVVLRRAGRVDEAVQIAMLRAGTMQAVHELDDELQAIETQGRAERRASVYQALMGARISIAAMTALGLLGLLLYLRQARQLGRHQQDLKAIERTLRDKLETEVAERTAELTDLTRYLLNAREDERNRLARNLHDDLGALLTSAKLDAARIKPRLAKSAPETLELLAHLVAILNACVALGRNIIENLRPSALSNLGLVATLEILAREFSENSNVAVQCQLEPVALDANAELIVYRVVQEALTNIAKYASASDVRITLESQGTQAVVSVHDNGVGFDAKTKQRAAFGLLGMRYRVEAEGGSLTVASAPGSTTVQASLNQQSPRAEAVG